MQLCDYCVQGLGEGATFGFNEQKGSRGQRKRQNHVTTPIRILHLEKMNWRTFLN